MTLFNVFIGTVVILGKIIAFCVLVGLLMLVYIIMREVAYTMHEENKRKLEEKEKHENDGV
jgi:H+/gluconate symporter-like permease